MMFGLLYKLVKNRCVFPVYHCVNDEKLPHISHLYRVRTQKEFIADLDFLLKYYNPVSMQTILEHPEILSQKNAFHLTFDDGLRQMYDVVIPILEKKGIPATFFINPSFLDNKELFYRFKISLLLDILEEAPESVRREASMIAGAIPSSFNALKNSLLKGKKNDEERINKLAELLNFDFNGFLRNYKPYMDSRQVESILKKGFTIGGHSMDHPYFPNLTKNEQIEQTIKSVDFVQEKFGLSYRLFAFPYTDYGIDATFFNHFYGNKKLLDLSFGTAGIKDDTYSRNIQRIFVEDYTSTKNALKQEYFEYTIKKLLNKHVIPR